MKEIRMKVLIILLLGGALWAASPVKKNTDAKKSTRVTITVIQGTEIVKPKTRKPRGNRIPVTERHYACATIDANGDRTQGCVHGSESLQDILTHGFHNGGAQ
jgi:hypothetical protein